MMALINILVHRSVNWADDCDRFVNLISVPKHQYCRTTHSSNLTEKISTFRAFQMRASSIVSLPE